MATITFTDADGVVQTLDTGQKQNVAYHADCRDILSAMPDKCIDLIVADPPYGDASSQFVNVERERESRHDARSGSTAAESETLGRSTSNGTVARTGGTWAEKYGKKS